MTMSISNHPVEHEELMAYLDGELSPDRATESAEHLEQCPECRQVAADLRGVSETLVAWRVEEAEREPAKKVIEELHKRAAEKSSSSLTWTWRSPLNPLRWPKPVWGLAGAALVMLLVFTPFVLRTRTAKNQSVMQDYYAPEPTISGKIPARQPAAPPKSARGTRQAQTELYAYEGLSSESKTPRASATPDPADSKLDDIRAGDEEEEAQDEEKPSNIPGANGPMIIRTAELQVTTDAFDKARPAVEDILKRHHGYVGELNVNTPTGSARSLTGALRVPANQLEATLSDLKSLGRTEKETQGGQEVTQQYVDLEARLANAKHTEQRLVEMQRDRTGKLSDVLAVEMQISRVRGEIEQMEAQRKTMKNQVDFATITITLAEAYKAELKAVPPSTGTQVRNAAVEGYRTLVDGIISVLLWLLSAGPTLLVWAAILFWPARMAWKRLKPRFVQR
jgi:Domain of unknown function (DUF4349)/Putative zinc-finger